MRMRRIRNCAGIMIRINSGRMVESVKEGITRVENLRNRKSNSDELRSEE